MKLWFLDKGLQFGFEFGDALALWSRGVLDLRGGITRGGERRAVPVIAENIDDENPLHLRPMVAGRHDFLGEVGILAGIENGGVTEDEENETGFKNIDHGGRFSSRWISAMAAG